LCESFDTGAMPVTCSVINCSTENTLHLHAQCDMHTKYIHILHADYCILLILKYNSYTVTACSIKMTLVHLVDSQ